jgi:hypothetical protein
MGCLVDEFPTGVSLSRLLGERTWWRDLVRTVWVSQSSHPSTIFGLGNSLERRNRYVTYVVPWLFISSVVAMMALWCWVLHFSVCLDGGEAADWCSLLEVGGRDTSLVFALTHAKNITPQIGHREKTNDRVLWLSLTTWKRNFYSSQSMQWAFVFCEWINERNLLSSQTTNAQTMDLINANVRSMFISL